MCIRVSSSLASHTDSSTAGLNSTATQTLVNPEYRSTCQIQTIYNGTLQGNHILSSRVKLNWSGVYSVAKQQLPDQATYNWNELVYYGKGGQIDSITNKVPVGTSNVVTHRWQHNKDQDLAGYGNLTYSPNVFGRSVEFMTGGLYRYKTRNDYNNQYALQADVSGNPNFTGIGSVPLYFQATGQNQGINTADNANTYTAHEKSRGGLYTGQVPDHKGPPGPCRCTCREHAGRLHDGPAAYEHTRRLWYHPLYRCIAQCPFEIHVDVQPEYPPLVL